MEKILIVGMVATLCWASSIAQNATAQSKTKKSEASTINGTIKKDHSVLTISKNGKTYRIVRNHGQVSELYINNNRISDQDIPKHQSIIDQLTAESAATEVPAPPPPPPGAGVDAFPTEQIKEDIINDLVREKIITNASDPVNVRLTNQVLMVNNKRQPDAVHNLFKKKYIDAAGGSSYEFTYKR